MLPCTTQDHAGVVEGVARGEVVAPVHDHVVVRDQVEHVLGREARAVLHDVHVRVERSERLARRLGLEHAEARGIVQDLALQVRGVDRVLVDDAERADTGRGQVERGGRAEPSGPDQEHFAVEQRELTLLANLGDEQVAAVAVALVVGQPARRCVGEPRVLPGPEAARQRRYVAVAHVLQ